MPTECSQDSFALGTVKDRIVVVRSTTARSARTRARCYWARPARRSASSRGSLCFQDHRNPDVIVHALPTCWANALSASRSATRISTIQRRHHTYGTGCLRRAFDLEALPLSSSGGQVDARSAGACCQGCACCGVVIDHRLALQHGCRKGSILRGHRRPPV